MRWADFANLAPELTGLGSAVFDDQHLCLIGTLRADGWPRISANEVYFVDGELLLGMMRNSRKATDLVRDPRITVMTPQAEREPSHGDFKLYGRAAPVADPGVRDHYGEAIFAAIGWRPDEPFPLFSVDIDSAVYITFGEGRRLLRWTAGGGVERLRHPDDPAG
jgi:hypothetical protein